MATNSPTSDGLSEEGLARVHDVLAGHVERGRMPGLIALVARQEPARQGPAHQGPAHRGPAHVDVIGTKAFGDTSPLARDAIFRIASLTKPIAALAAMILVEEGTLHLQHPVDDLLPELADRRVLRSLDADLDDTVPANRPITLEDLLTFRLGFGCIMAPPDTYPIQTAEAELELASLGPPWPPMRLPTDEWMRRLGTLPLMHQPGEQWMYGTGTQVLGALLERATGMSIEDVLRERIFEPLGMVDTSFTVTADRIDRLTTAYTPDAETGALDVLDGVEDSYWRTPLPFPNASGWLVSTIDDYWAFVQLMLDKGEHDGRRILSPASVELMTTDHLSAGQRSGNEMFLGRGGGWGLGLLVPAAGVAGHAGHEVRTAVVGTAGVGTAGAGTPGIPGGFGWDGGSGTTWRSDIDRGLTGILFTQRAMTSPEPPQVVEDFWVGAYGAIDG